MLDWVLAPLATLAALGAAAWLAPWAVRRLLRDFRSTPSGGSAFKPLQEIIQPQIRHVEQIREQRREDDDRGGPPLR